MDRDEDILRLRDELTRRFDLVLRPSAVEIARFREEAARLAMLAGDPEAAEKAAARLVFLVPSAMPGTHLSTDLRSAA